ncbi:unnamed protein product [Mesocestoides corti]|uniref:Ima1 N-terminal domain-containing protein n=1 Tax=Mesocestoides corti TaxID=53468 RepID=A0A0R3UCH1_MESCO|nr:unnamed protein product [Mesocestoides corti]
MFSNVSGIIGGSILVCTLIYLFYNSVRLFRNRRLCAECWFCRTQNLVQVHDRNSFYCFACHQYNGFTNSGDYNRLLPAQWEPSLNPSGFSMPCKRSASNFTTHSDILCPLCSQKQEYMINQLAGFEASSEATWDYELNLFKQGLERRCMLCSVCKVKVHKTIKQVNLDFCLHFITVNLWLGVKFLVFTSWLI